MNLGDVVVVVELSDPGFTDRADNAGIPTCVCACVLVFSTVSGGIVLGFIYIFFF